MRIGDIVLYMAPKADTSLPLGDYEPENKNAEQGEIVPAIITAIKSPGVVNLKLMLDSPNISYMQDVKQGYATSCWQLRELVPVDALGRPDFDVIKAAVSSGEGFSMIVCAGSSLAMVADSSGQMFYAPCPDDTCRGAVGSPCLHREKMGVNFGGGRAS